MNNYCEYCKSYQTSKTHLKSKKHLKNFYDYVLKYTGLTNWYPNVWRYHELIDLP